MNVIAAIIRAKAKRLIRGRSFGNSKIGPLARPLPGGGAAFFVKKNEALGFGVITSFAKHQMLELEDISKSFGDTQALKPVSMEFDAGSTTALLGPSGCGKSTLLRIIMGLLPSDTGRVTLEGVEMTPANMLEIRHRMGYMIQDGGLFPHLTIRQNVGLMADYLGWTADKIQNRFVELAKLTHLPKESYDRFPNEVSGGQRQRVALMRALFLDPAVVLLDEPMGALDPLIRSELQAELRSIFSSLNKTVIVVTHDIAEAGFLAEEIVLLKQGEIAQIGKLKELVDSPKEKFVEEFINAQRSPLESLEAIK